MGSDRRFDRTKAYTPRRDQGNPIYAAGSMESMY